MDLSDLDGVSLIPDQDIDNRSDDEISNHLKTFCAPATTDSNKNVWAYWRTGYNTMPPWTQRNLINWIRRLGPTWTVRLLDSIPDSPTNVTHFIPPHFFPPAFNKGKMSGPYVGAHSGDLVRLPLLELYGGVWMDVGTILIRHLDDIWNVIQDPSTPYELAGMTLRLRPDDDSEEEEEEDVMVNNFLVVASRDNEYIKRWHRIYLSLWADDDDDDDDDSTTTTTITTESLGFHAHPILRHMRLYSPPKEKNAPEIQMDAGLYTDYLAHTLSGERLRDLIDSNDGFNGRDYYQTKTYLLPVLKEMYHFPKKCGWDGNKEFEVLATRYDTTTSTTTSTTTTTTTAATAATTATTATATATPEDTISDQNDNNDKDDEDGKARFQRAKEIVNEMLQNTFMIKLSHGPKGSSKPWLADIWNNPRYQNADNEPGTFAFYLRQAILRTNQTRPLKPRVIKPLTAKLWKAGLVEPCQGL